MEKRTSCATVEIEDLELVRKWVRDAMTHRTQWPFLHTDAVVVMEILDDAIEPLDTIELIIPQAQLDDANEHLKYSTPFGGEDNVYTWTADVGRDGLEVDIKVVDAEAEGGGPWTEAVLFQNGHEIACSDVDESVEGEWIFRDHRVRVVVKGSGYCGTCGGTGEVDSGAPDPQGHFIEVTCPECKGGKYATRD